jgi:hypothetical protein
VEAFGLLIKFKMVDIAMVTKVQKLLNLFQTSRNPPKAATHYGGYSYKVS